jgi:Pectate lyase superfamily protein
MADNTNDTVVTGFVNLDNVVLTGVPTAVTQNGKSILIGGSRTINSWIYGRVYDVDHPNGLFTSGGILKNPHPMTPSLGGGPNQGYFERSRPQYEFVTADHFINARKYATGGLPGLLYINEDTLTSVFAGDGKTDDTDGLNKAFAAGIAGKLNVYIPAGTYMVTDTVFIPSGSIIIGECWPQIMATGAV